MLFQEKRLMFMAPPGGEGPKPAAEKPAMTADQVKETAKKAAIENAKKNPDQAQADAAKMVESAKTEVDKVPGVKDDKVKEEAKGKLDKAQAEFTEIVGMLSRRLELKKNLDSLDPSKPNFDFLHAAEKIKEFKGERDKLMVNFSKEDSVLAGVEVKETAINGAARASYDGLSSRLGEALTTQLKGPTKEGLAQLMQYAGEAQHSDYLKFPGLVEADIKPYQTDFSQKISAALDLLNKNAASLDADSQGALKRLQFARENLAGAEKDKEPGHLAGAKEYMEMALAEQEARRVWNSLPYDADPGKSWRSADINTAVDQGWNKEGDNYKNYLAALSAFKEGLKLSANREVGDSAKAKDLFKKAAEGWRKLLEAQTVKENKEGKEAYEKAYEPFKDEYDKAKRGKNVEALIKSEHTDLYTKLDLEKTDAAKVKEVTDKLIAAKTDLEKLNTYLDAVKNKYAAVLEAAVKEYNTKDRTPRDYGAAVATMVHDYMNNGSYLSEVKFDYNSSIVPTKAVLADLGEFPKSFYSTNRGNIQYDVKVSYATDGTPKVSVYDHGYAQNFEQSAPSSYPGQSSEGAGGGGGASSEVPFDGGHGGASGDSGVSDQAPAGTGGAGGMSGNVPRS